MSKKSFPKPSDLPVPAGAEGWEKLYPYYLVFQDELKDKENEKFWFCDSQHWPTVFKPFETIGAEYAVKCLGQYNARHLMIPNANGIEFRVHLGYLYMSPIPVPDDQVADRVPEFQARITHYFQNWDSMLEDWKVKVRGTIDELESLTFNPLPDMVPMADIESGKAMDGSEILLENYDRLIALAYRNWQYHFEFLNLGYIAYLDFFNFCKEVFPDIPDQSIANMVQGVDMELFRPDDELKELAILAVELGLQEHFADTDDAEGTLAALAASPGGERWIARWDEAQDPWFNFTVGNGFYGHDKYWIDHLEIPLGFIADYIRRLDEGQIIKRPTAELIAEKDRIVDEYRELLDAEQLAVFDAKRGLAATAYPYVENHNFYIEHWTMGVFWRKVRELSRMLHAHGFWPEADDMLYLTRNEVRDALFDLVTGHGVGAPDGPIGPVYWPEIIEERRAMVAALKTARPAPALNTPPESITEPFTRMLWGITTEQVQSWLGNDEDTPEGTLKGMAASPGVVEGYARVIMDADEISEIRQDEILVAPVTAPSWGPVFGKLKAAVTDIGGMMSHAAIVCREYALPAVTGTGSASTTIRTGQLLRVDGTRGTVEVLDDRVEDRVADRDAALVTP
jgi:pyruvate,water dikinase